MFFRKDQDMKLEKNGKTYEVIENSKKWVINAMAGKVVLKYEISKTDCETYEELKQYMEDSKMF